MREIKTPHSFKVEGSLWDRGLLAAEFRGEFLSSALRDALERYVRAAERDARAAGTPLGGDA